MQLRDPRQVLAHLFSRGVLGSALVAVSVGKVVEKLVIILAPMSPFHRLIGWSVAAALFVTLYVYWADFEQAVEDATDAVSDSGEDDDD